MIMSLVEILQIELFTWAWEDYNQIITSMESVESYGN